MPTFNQPGDAMLTPDGTSIMLASGAPRVKQRLTVGVQTILGSYKYDANAGLPWFEWFEQGQRVPMEGELRKFFLKQPEVQTVNELTLSVNRTTRLMSVRYSLQLKDGSEITSTTPIAQVNA